MGMKLVDVLYEPVIKVRCFIRLLQSYFTWWTGYWVCSSLPTHQTDIREAAQTTADCCYVTSPLLTSKLFVVTIKQHFWLRSRQDLSSYYQHIDTLTALWNLIHVGESLQPYCWCLWTHHWKVEEVLNTATQLQKMQIQVVRFCPQQRVRLQPRVVYRAVYLQMKTQETLPVTTSHVIIKRIISVQGYSCLLGKSCILYLQRHPPHI